MRRLYACSNHIDILYWYQESRKRPSYRNVRLTANCCRIFSAENADRPTPMERSFSISKTPMMQNRKMQHGSLNCRPEVSEIKSHRRSLLTQAETRHSMKLGVILLRLRALSYKSSTTGPNVMLHYNAARELLSLHHCIALMLIAWKNCMTYAVTKQGCLYIVIAKRPITRQPNGNFQALPIFLHKAAGPLYDFRFKYCENAQGGTLIYEDTADMLPTMDFEIKETITVLQPVDSLCFMLVQKRALCHSYCIFSGNPGRLSDCFQCIFGGPASCFCQALRFGKVFLCSEKHWGPARTTSKSKLSFFTYHKSSLGLCDELLTMYWSKEVTYWSEFCCAYFSDKVMFCKSSAFTKE
eukprot:IDg4403t1